jgi:hypothetical protein
MWQKMMWDNVVNYPISFVNKFNFGKICLKRTLSFLFHLIKPINSFCAVIQNDSLDGSLQLVAACMVKSPCEQFIIFTCNIHTDDSSHSSYINSRYKAFYSPIQTYCMRTWVRFMYSQEYNRVNIIWTSTKDFSWKKMIQFFQILKGFFFKPPVCMIKTQ